MYKYDDDDDDRINNTTDEHGGSADLKDPAKLLTMYE